MSLYAEQYVQRFQNKRWMNNNLCVCVRVCACVCMCVCVCYRYPSLSL